MNDLAAQPRAAEFEDRRTAFVVVCWFPWMGFLVYTKKCFGQSDRMEPEAGRSTP